MPSNDFDMPFKKKGGGEVSGITFRVSPSPSHPSGSFGRISVHNGGGQNFDPGTTGDVSAFFHYGENLVSLEVWTPAYFSIFGKFTYDIHLELRFNGTAWDPPESLTLQRFGSFAIHPFEKKRGFRQGRVTLTA